MHKSNDAADHVTVNYSRK